MNRRNVLVGLLFSVCVLTGFSRTALAGDQVPFRGVLEGSYTLTVNPPVATLDGIGRGVATHLGRFSYAFPHTVTFSPTAPPAGAGTYSFTAANGDNVYASFTGQSTPVAPGFVYVVEDCVITGGTGRFANASGRFTVMRLVDQVNRRTSGSFEGTISSPGSNKR